MTKPGKYGTLYLFAVAYQCDADRYNGGTLRVWAYDAEHAVEKFYDGDDGDAGWIATSVKRVNKK